MDIILAFSIDAVDVNDIKKIIFKIINNVEQS